MRGLVTCVLVFVAHGVVAEDALWTPLSGEEMRAALTGRTLHYENAWQEFRVSGRTLYNAGHDSWGYWRIEGAQYCSQWPPSDIWACYDIARSDTKIRFIGAQGDFTDGEFRE